MIPYTRCVSHKCLHSKDETREKSDTTIYQYEKRRNLEETNMIKDKNPEQVLANAKASEAS